jgi:hypothetical protein
VCVTTNCCFHERQTVTGRNVQVVKFLVFLIGLLVHLFPRSFDLRSSMWLKASVKFYIRRKQRLNYFCFVYFSCHVDIQYISTFGFLFYLFIFIFYCERERERESVCSSSSSSSIITSFSMRSEVLSAVSIKVEFVACGSV